LGLVGLRQQIERLRAITNGGIGTRVDESGGGIAKIMLWAILNLPGIDARLDPTY
jgi:hypothetical protein